MEAKRWLLQVLVALAFDDYQRATSEIGSKAEPSAVELNALQRSWRLAQLALVTEFPEEVIDQKPR